MSYLKRYPPQGGRQGHLHVISESDMPDAGASLAALLWSNGITAVADIRTQPDPNLKETVEQYGVAYGHIPASEMSVRLRRAEQLYHTLAVTSASGASASENLREHLCESLPCTRASGSEGAE